ncbi:hypothetical protein GCM10029992_32700 [Glycomyces albus]
MKRLRLTVCALGIAAFGALGSLIPSAAQAHPHDWDDFTYWGAYPTSADCIDTGWTLSHRYNWHAFTCGVSNNDGRWVYTLWYVPTT